MNAEAKGKSWPYVMLLSLFIAAVLKPGSGTWHFECSCSVGGLTGEGAGTGLSGVAVGMGVTQ